MTHGGGKSVSLKALGSVCVVLAALIVVFTWIGSAVGAALGGGSQFGSWVWLVAAAVIWLVVVATIAFSLATKYDKRTK